MKIVARSLARFRSKSITLDKKFHRHSAIALLIAATVLINLGSGNSELFSLVIAKVHAVYHSDDGSSTHKLPAWTAPNLVNFALVQTCPPTLNPASQSFPASGGTNTVAVMATADCAWTAVSNDAWITITSGAVGSGSGAVSYAVAANPGPARSGTMTIAGQTFGVTQYPNCAFSIAPTNQNFAASGGGGSVGVTTATGCAWTAASNDAWITISSGASGSGPGVVSFSVAANTGPQRTGTMTIAGQTFTATQSSGCAFTIAPSEQNFAAGGGTGNVGVTASAGGCAWTAASNDAWITITSGGNGAGNGTVNYSVAANTGPQRTGTMTIAGQTFSVTQASGCAYIISPSAQSFPASGGSDSVTVTTAAGCVWTAVSNDAWITIASGASGAGPGAVGFSVAANTGPQRTGTITIAGQTFTVTQSSGCVFTLSSTSQTFSASGGANSVDVTAIAACAWAAVSNDPWITITFVSGGAGNGTVSYTVAANPGPQRTGTMTIAGQTFSITQVCTYTINPTSQNFPASGGASTVAVSAGTGCGWTAAAVVRTEPELPRAFLDTTYVPPQRTPTFVPAGADLQAAIDAAQPGDVLALEAGATFVGNFTLPAKSGSDWIVIRSSAPDSSLPPPGARITPAYANVLPKILTPNAVRALEARNGAHHYRLMGLEFGITPTCPLTYSIVSLGEGQTSLAQLPHHIILDRVYIHGRPTIDVRRGVALNSASSAIIDSYISDCHERFFDSQAVLGWNGPGPFKIVNNYLEGAGENIMFGGATPTIPNLVPSDIEFRRNHCFKPLIWKADDPSYNGIDWSIKNLFELKNAQRVLVEGNIFEQNWQDSQAGFAIQLTVRNEEGAAPWAVVQDVTFINNIIRHSGAGLSVHGRDDILPPPNPIPSRRIRIANNLFDDIDGPRWGNAGGRLFQIVSGVSDLTIDHNTAFHSGNPAVADVLPVSEAFTFSNNLASNSEFGFFGSGHGQGISALDYYFPGYLFRRNVLVGGPSALYPADNFFPETFAQIGFMDFAGGNYRLAASSPYRNAGTDGKDIGCDFDALNAALSGSVTTAPNVSHGAWITITSGASGAGPGVVGYSVAPNPGPARAGTMVIGGRTFTVLQDSGCAFTLNSTNQNFTNAGGQGSVSVMASSAGCVRTAVSNAPWITLASGGNGSGNGTVNYTVSANAGPQRTGTMTIAGQTFTVTQAAAEYEADVAPRPGGSGTLLVSDWVQAGRFSVGLDTPAPGSEFQRADSAPRATLGDGLINVADWVQAGRYSVGLDPPTPPGGPAMIAAAPFQRSFQFQPAREIQISRLTIAPEPESIEIVLALAARGGESGLSFTLRFDPRVLSYQAYRVVTEGTTSVTRTDEAPRGHLGFGIALQPGTSLVAGRQALLIIRFRVSDGQATGTTVEIVDGLTPLALADVNATPLPVKPVPAMIDLRQFRWPIGASEHELRGAHEQWKMS
jgi:hypothetical protein